MPRLARIANWARRFGYPLIVVGLLIAPVCGQEKTNTSSFDPALLSGEWKFLDGKRAGSAASDESLASMVTITEKEFTLAGGTGTFVIAYQLNPQTDPMQVDLEITAGPAPQSKAMGIMKVADGKMTICYDPNGAARPDKFESTESNGWHLFELQKKPFDKEKLIGKWRYESGQRAGEPIDGARLQATVTISKDKFIVPAGPEDEFVMAYTLDDKRFPAGIDMSIESGPAPAGNAVGIIKMDNGKIVLCYDPTGAKRPDEFKTTAGDGFFLFVLERLPDEPNAKDDAKQSDGSGPK